MRHRISIEDWDAISDLTEAGREVAVELTYRGGLVFDVAFVDAGEGEAETSDSATTVAGSV